MITDFAVFALLLAAYALIAARLERFSVGPAVAFVIIGVVISEQFLGFVSLAPEAEAIKLLAEAALTLLLFADASDVSSRALRHDIGPIVRLLFIGLPLTIGLGTVGAALLFPGISFGVALLIGSALSPTDAALGQAVVTNTTVPARVRRVLNVESGLNDGIATPFVFLAIGLAGAEVGHAGFIADALIESLGGVIVGAVLGFAGGWLLDRSVRADWSSTTSAKLFVLALAVACYLVALAFGVNGFIAAFVGGLAFGAGSRQHDEAAVRFTETQGSLLTIGVWASFGLLIATQIGVLWNVNAFVFALLSLTALRMVPVALVLMGSGFRPRSVAFIGWFGPRGLASIVFLIIGIEGLHDIGVDDGPVVATVLWTVLLSVILHGISAGPLARVYGRWTSTLPQDAAELADTPEPTSRRVAWAGPSPV